MLGLKGKNRRLRMEGITQSYNMYDSIAYKKTKTIERLMKKTNNEYKLEDEK